jgi:hypothetical protein
MAASRQYQQPYTVARSQQAPTSRQQQKPADYAEVLTEEETFEETSERERAADYLESTEMLMWLANSRKEVSSVFVARHHESLAYQGFSCYFQFLLNSLCFIFPCAFTSHGPVRITTPAIPSCPRVSPYQ